MSGKKSVLAILILGAASLAGCSSSSSSTTTSNTPPPTGLKKRVLVSNQHPPLPSPGIVNIVDAQRDVLSTKTISTSAPTKMVTAGGQTAMINSNGAQISIFDNTTEAITFAPLTADIPTDIVISPDGKTVWVAERNNGFVQSIDTASGVVTNSIPVPSVRRLVLSPNGTQLLAFSDNPQGLPAPNPNPPSPNPPNPFQDAFFVIDTAAVVNTHQATPIQMSPGDQPFTAVFNANETKAFILNCGSGCGGTDRTVANSPTPPSVAIVDFTNAAAPLIGPRVAVPAATAGLLQGADLYIAGTTSPAAAVSPGMGFLQVVDAASLALAGAPVQITDGLHTLIVPTANNRLYIGAQGCTPGPIQNNTRAGCLTIANITSPTAPTVTVPVESSFRQNFDVTAIQPISGRSVVYVAEGGELDFFDANTDAVSTTITPIDIVGTAFGIVQIDP